MSVWWVLYNFIAFICNVFYFDLLHILFFKIYGMHISLVYLCVYLSDRPFKQPALILRNYERNGCMAVTLLQQHQQSTLCLQYHNEYVLKPLTCLADRNSSSGKIKCLSKYWPIREVRSNLAIVEYSNTSTAIHKINTCKNNVSM